MCENTGCDVNVMTGNFITTRIVTFEVGVTTTDLSRWLCGTLADLQP